MKIEDIVSELDNGGVFISNFDEIKKVCKALEVKYLPRNLKHSKLIKISKVNDEDYIVQPCNTINFINNNKNDLNTFRFYFGSLKKEVFSSVNDLDLLDNLKTNKHDNCITVNAIKDEYIYICYPAKYGIRKFTVNGFEGGFHKSTKILFGQKFDIYRSTNQNLGLTKIYVN